MARSAGTGWSFVCQSRFAIRVVVGLALLRLLGGCAAVPDATLFAEATEQLIEADAAVSAARAGDLDGSASDLQASDRARERFFDAARSYSKALAALSHAPNADAGPELADKLAHLVASVSLGSIAVAPAAPVISAGGVAVLASDGAVLVYQQLELVRRARLMRDAVVSAQPIIERVAELLRADAADSEEIFAADCTLRRIEAVSEYNTVLAFAGSLEERQSGLRATNIRTMSDAETRELASIQGLLATAAADRHSYQSRLEELTRLCVQQRKQIANFRGAIGAWERAHEELVDSFEQSR